MTETFDELCAVVQGIAKRVGSLEDAKARQQHRVRKLEEGQGAGAGAATRKLIQELAKADTFGPAGYFVQLARAIEAMQPEKPTQPSDGLPAWVAEHFEACEWKDAFDDRPIDGRVFPKRLGYDRQWANVAFMIEDATNVIWLRVRR